MRASRQIHETIGKVFGLTSPKQKLIEEGARLIDEAFGTDEVVKAIDDFIEMADDAISGRGGWDVEHVMDNGRRILSKLKGTDDGKDKS